MAASRTLSVCTRAHLRSLQIYELAYTGNFAAVVVIVIVFSLLHPFKICANGMDQRRRHFPHESTKRKMTEQIKEMLMMMIGLDKSSIIERENIVTLNSARNADWFYSIKRPLSLFDEANETENTLIIKIVLYYKF